MKYILTERQLDLIKESESKIFKISFDAVGNNWALLQKLLERRGYPKYILTGHIDLTDHSNLDFENLIGVEGNLDLRRSNISSLKSLKYVDGHLTLSESGIRDLGDLEYVSGYCNIAKTQRIKNLNKLRKVGKGLIIKESEIRDLGDLEYVGGTLNIYFTWIRDFGNLKFIGKDLIGYDGDLSEEEILEKVHIGGDIIMY